MEIIDKNTAFIKSEAQALGFTFCGISKAGFLEEQAPKFENWLSQNMHGQMSYMQNYFDKRLDPTLLVPGSKSVVTVLFNYFTNDVQHPDAPKVSKYAFGEDYHFVFKDKLKQLLIQINQKIGAVEGRVFTDSAPVMERAWAAKSGLGWIGKHTLLINKKQGSYFFIGELILDIELNYDHAVKDFCGTCTACIDACPTDAITHFGINANKCISYLTIELKENISEEFKHQMKDWAFGCDICQEVCPWNRFSKPHAEENFIAKNEFLGMNKSDWLEMDKKKFNEMFKNTPLKRAGFDKIKNTLQLIYGKD